MGAVIAHDVIFFFLKAYIFEDLLIFEYLMLEINRKCYLKGI